MYKRFSIEDIKKIQNNFIANLYNVVRKENCISIIDFFKKIFKEGDDIYYFNRSETLFKFSQKDNNIIISDEKEKIEIVLDENKKRELQNLFKEYMMKKNKSNHNSNQKSIEQILLDAFNDWWYSTINNKKYLVYDIETTWSLENLKEVKFSVAYSMEPNEQNKMTYEYISRENLKEFVQKMINFDWYIVWFNNIRFDNPVCIYNVWLSDEETKILNEKSIDLYVLISSISGKRMWLNKVSEALVGVSKTLESWAEWETLFQKYLETWEEEYLETLKKYCKNDVRMTALVFLYLMHFKKIYIEWDEITFSMEDIINKSWVAVKEVKENQNQSIF